MERSELLCVVLLCLVGCNDDDSPQREPDGGPSADASADAAPGVSPFVTVECDDLLSPPESSFQVSRSCVYPVPAGATSQLEGEQVVVRADGGVIASYGRCTCGGPPFAFPTILILPAGETPATYQPEACPVAAADFSQQCNSDADCTEVFLGDACANDCTPLCANAAINKSSSSAYETKRASLKHYGAFFDFCACPTFGVPRCSNGTCALKL